MMKRRTVGGERVNYLMTRKTNPEVFDVCLAQGWCTAKGMTYEEAAAVTNAQLGEVFRGNTSITHFEELQWFDGLTKLHANAFNGCSNLTAIGIPPTVTSQASGFLTGNSKVSKIYIRDLSAFCRISGGSSTIYLPRAAQVYLYLNNTVIHDLVIPSDVTYIGPMVFFHCRFESVSIPSTLKTFNYRCLEVYNNDSLTPPIPVVYCLPNLHDWVNDSSRAGENNAMTGSFPNAVGGLYIGGNLMTGVIDIPNGVTTIGFASFKGAKQITQINMPTTVISIKQQAFDACTGITSITIPGSVTSLGRAVLRNCTKLTSLTIPDSVTSIGLHAFSGCTKLESAVLSSGLKTIAYSLFQNCTKLTDVTLRSSQLTSLDIRFLENCVMLQNLYIYTKNAPTMSNWATTRKIGQNQTGAKTLFVPSDATGYDSGNWLNFCNTYGFTLSKTL